MEHKLFHTTASFTWAAARILPKDFSCSRSAGGQMQGSIGAVISQSKRTTFFFLSARYFANFTARVVLPLPGLPHTARTPPCRIYSSSLSSVFLLNIPFFLKLSNLFHLTILNFFLFFFLSVFCIIINFF